MNSILRSLLYTLIFLLAACTPRASQSDPYDGKRPRPNVAYPDLNLVDHLGGIPEPVEPILQFSERIIRVGSKLSLRQKMAIKLKIGQSTAQIRNADRSCGVIKVLDVVPNLQLKVSYIVLGQKGVEGIKKAEEVIEKYKTGVAFAELARIYSKDGGSENGGELDWFNASSMVKGFSEAILEHKKGEIYKANTVEYGWYVILHTHDTRDLSEYKILEVTGYDNCN